MPKNLTPISVVAPAFYGLNSQRKADILDFSWATKIGNCSIDDSGRIAARNGYQNAHASAIAASPDVKSMFEYIDASGNKLQILAAGNAIYKLVGGTLTDISGSITTPTGDNWKFQNFNGRVVGFQSGHAPVVMTSVAGTFADISLSGTQQPTTNANEVMAAFGRLWCLDGTDLKYSDALDQTTWNGVFDLTTVWLAGMDIGTALAEFNGHLVVFGNSSIVIYNNPWVPTGGGSIDTTAMSLVENIGEIGCIARDSVQFIGTDILFLSAQGVRSLGRTIQEKSMPVNDLSRNVNDELNDLVSGETPANIKSAYSKAKGFYLLTLPVSNKTYYFDLRRPLEDRSFRVTRWDMSFKSMYVNSSNVVYLGTAGYINKHQGYLDNVSSDGSGGSTYELTYESGWNDLGMSGVNKIPKKIGVLVLGGEGQTMVVKWAFDFVDSFSSFTNTIAVGNNAEYNVAEYNIDEWSGGLSYNRIKAPMSKSGQVIKFGISITINGASVALQQIDMFSKIGRMA